MATKISTEEETSNLEKFFTSLVYAFIGAISGGAGLMWFTDILYGVYGHISPFGYWQSVGLVLFIGLFVAGIFNAPKFDH